MRHRTIPVTVQRMAFLVLAGGLALLGAPLRVEADALPEFTGYTRPGVPGGHAASKEGQIVFVADDGEKKDALLGGTVYFTVIDTTLDTEENNVWRKLSRDMIRAFEPGK